jgi:hypothetical protein
MLKKSKRVLISVPLDILKKLNEVNGLGKSDAEKIRNIIIAFLSDHGYLDKKKV